MKKKTRFREKFGFGIGAMGKDMYYSLLSTYLMVFLTDTAGLAPAAVGTLLLVVRIWDGVNDPLVGILVDRTRSRWGRFRPYLMFVPVVLGGGMLALFSPPDLGPAGKLVWAYAFYILVDIAYTAFDIPLMAMTSAITSDAADRTSLIAHSRIWTLIAAGGVGIATMPLVSALGRGDALRGYRLFVAAMAVVAVVCSWIAFLNTRERVAPDRSSNTLRDYLRILSTNEPFITLMCASILLTVGFGIASGVTVYYLTYALRNAALIPFVMAAGMVLPLPIMAVVPAMSRRLGKRKAMACGLLALGGAIGLKFFFPNAIIQVALTAVQGFGFAVSMVVLTSMVADTVDYAEWKTGARSEGLIFSLSTFSTKLGTAVAGAAVGYVLSLSGYVPNTEQSPAAIAGITLMYSLVPSALLLLPVVVLLLGYRLTEERHAEICSELEQKRAAGHAAIESGPAADRTEGGIA